MAPSEPPVITHVQLQEAPMEPIKSSKTISINRKLRWSSEVINKKEPLFYKSYGTRIGSFTAVRMTKWCSKKIVIA